MQRSDLGFTLMELILVTAISAILLSMATPYLGDFISNQRLSAATRTLQLELMYARAMAIAEHGNTVLCPSNTGELCLNSSLWHGGWILFQDQNGDRERQPNETLVRVSGALDGVEASSSRYRKRIRFLPNGTAVGTAMTITICPDIDTGNAHQLVIANSGSIRQVRSSGQAALIQCAV